MTFSWPHTPLNVVLVQPEIPPNTGNIARTCAATGSRLHLVRPLGFSLDDKHLRRAGLDYWPHVDLTLHDSLADCLRGVPGDHVWYFSKKATRLHYQASFRPGHWLVFGPETRGLDETILEHAGAQALALPMRGSSVRSLNLGSAAAAALFEALRQTQS